MTRRRCAEQALREREELLRNIIANIPCGVFWKDRDSVYLGCNDQVARDNGLEHSRQVVGRSDYEICHSPDGGNLLSRMRPASDSYRRSDPQPRRKPDAGRGHRHNPPDEQGAAAEFERGGRRDRRSLSGHHRAKAARGTTPTGAKDGSGGAARRGNRPRLQQPPHHHSRQRRSPSHTADRRNDDPPN